MIRDPSATWAERDDAVIDLGTYEEPEVMATLISVASDVDEDEMIVASAGESIAEVWERQERFDADVLARVLPVARSEIEGWFGSARPDLLPRHVPA